MYLTGLGGDDKFAINSHAFMARGYSLWRTLRRMEMENVDSQHLGWITYVMHIEARQATLAASSTHAPITSVLVPTHSPTVLSTVLDRQAEGFDVAQIFDRERAFLSWNLHNPMRAMHDAARVAVVFEVVLVIVLLVTLLGNIAPWCAPALPCFALSSPLRWAPPCTPGSSHLVSSSLSACGCHVSQQSRRSIAFGWCVPGTVESLCRSWRTTRLEISVCRVFGQQIT